MGMVGIVALILTTSIIVAPITNWVMGISRSVGESNSKLEAVTVSQSEWERLQHMSLNELRSNKTALATPYNVGDGFQVKVNLGAEGYFSGGTCGNIPSGKTANCFKDTTITVFNSDGDRLFSSRQLPLQVGLYTTEEIDAKLTAMKNDYNNKVNANTTKINNVSSNLTNNYYTKTQAEKRFVLNHYQNGTLSAGWDGSEMHYFYNSSEIDGGGGSGGFPDLSRGITWDYNSTENDYFKINIVGGNGWGYDWSGTFQAKKNLWCVRALVSSSYWSSGSEGQHSGTNTASANIWYPVRKGQSVNVRSYFGNGGYSNYMQHYANVTCYPAK